RRGEWSPRGQAPPQGLRGLRVQASGAEVRAAGAAARPPPGRGRGAPAVGRGLRRLGQPGGGGRPV
ncbi:unnamed protein product, partial [Prorocentrum cordatum]